MFKEFSQIASMLKNLPKMREDMEKFQKQLGDIIGEGDAGGGMVHARANGHFEVLSVRIAPESVNVDDRELLEDLVTAAVNQAIRNAKQKVAEETQKMMGGMGLPPGLGLPGMP